MAATCFLPLLASLMVLSCGGAPERAKQGEQGANGNTIRGIVAATSPERGMVTIEHDATESMGAMRMEYKLANPATLASLPVGKRIEGRVEVRSGEKVLVVLEIVPGNPGR